MNKKTIRFFIRIYNIIYQFVNMKHDRHNSDLLFILFRSYGKSHRMARIQKRSWLTNLNKNKNVLWKNYCINNTRFLPFFRTVEMRKGRSNFPLKRILHKKAHAADEYWRVVKRQCNHSMYGVLIEFTQESAEYYVKSQLWKMTLTSTTSSWQAWTRRGGTAADSKDQDDGRRRKGSEPNHKLHNPMETRLCFLRLA